MIKPKVLHVNENRGSRGQEDGATTGPYCAARHGELAIDRQHRVDDLGRRRHSRTGQHGQSNRDMQLNFPLANLLEFACTEDQGATWSRPVMVDAPPPNAVDLSSAVLVLPDGALLGVFERIDIAPDLSATEEFFATRFPDGGETLLPPVEIGSMPIVRLADPETGDQLPQPGFLSAAAGPDGTVYVVWERQALPRQARSTWDGRRTAEAPGPCHRCRA